MHSTVKIKFLKIFILISEILSLAKLVNQKRFIMNINSMLQNTNIKQTWHIINSIFNIKNSTVGNIVKKIIQDYIVLEDSEELATMFNDYFAYIEKNIE